MKTDEPQAECRAAFEAAYAAHDACLKRGGTGPAALYEAISAALAASGRARVVAATEPSRTKCKCPSCGKDAEKFTENGETHVICECFI